MVLHSVAMMEHGSRQTKSRIQTSIKDQRWLQKLTSLSSPDDSVGRCTETMGAKVLPRILHGCCLDSSKGKMGSEVYMLFLEAEMPRDSVQE